MKKFETPKSRWLTADEVKAARQIFAKAIALWAKRKPIVNSQGVRHRIMEYQLWLSMIDLAARKTLGITPEEELQTGRNRATAARDRGLLFGIGRVLDARIVELWDRHPARHHQRSPGRVRTPPPARPTSSRRRHGGLPCGGQ